MIRLSFYFIKNLIPNFYILIIYLIYLVFTIAVVLFPFWVFKNIEWWRRASFASITFTVASLVVFFLIVWLSPKFEIGQKKGIGVALLLLPLILFLMIVFIFLRDLISNTVFHILYAEAVALLLGVSDLVVYRGLREHGSNNANILLNTLLHVDIPIFGGCTTLLVFSLVGPIIRPEMQPKEMEPFLAGAITFQFFITNTAYAWTESHLQL